MRKSNVGSCSVLYEARLHELLAMTKPAALQLVEGVVGLMLYIA